MQILGVSEVINHESNTIGLYIEWMINNGETAPIPIEFGNLVIEVDSLGNVRIDTESMGKEHFLKVMELLYDMAEVK